MNVKNIGVQLQHGRMPRYKKEITLLCTWECNINISLRCVILIFAIFHFFDIFVSVFPTPITLDPLGNIIAFILLIIAWCKMNKDGDDHNYRSRIFKLYAIIIFLMMGPFLLFRILLIPQSTEIMRPEVSSGNNLVVCDGENCIAGGSDTSDIDGNGFKDSVCADLDKGEDKSGDSSTNGACTTVGGGDLKSSDDDDLKSSDDDDDDDTIGAYIAN